MTRTTPFHLANIPVTKPNKLMTKKQKHTLVRNRTGRSVLLEKLSRELDRDETALHALELERVDEVDRQRRRAVRERGEAEVHLSSASIRSSRVKHM